MIGFPIPSTHLTPNCPVVLQNGRRQSTRTEWQTVFYLTAAVSVAGALFFVIFAKGTLQDWARQDDAEDAAQEEREKLNLEEREKLDQEEREKLNLEERVSGV